MSCDVSLKRFWDFARFVRVWSLSEVAWIPRETCEAVLVKRTAFFVCDVESLGSDVEGDFGPAAETAKVKSDVRSTISINSS